MVGPYIVRTESYQRARSFLKAASAVVFRYTIWPD
jgi:hypothetical protein